MKDIEELWKPIKGFPFYRISNLGRVYNDRTDSIMSQSLSNYDRLKISLQDQDKRRYTRAIAMLVAEHFVKKPKTGICDFVIILDQDPLNVAAYNLAWRPKWFVQRYSVQFKNLQGNYGAQVEITNTFTDACYPSILDAAMKEGLLCSDIFRSCMKNVPIFPYGHIYRFTENYMNWG